MRICVFGAGAIGGLMASRLAGGGAQVSVVARGAHLQAICATGLVVRDAAGATVTTHPAASDDPAALGVQDAVIVAVKAPALPSVASSIAPLLGPETAVVFAMNGIPWWYFHAHGGALDGRRLPLLDPGGTLEAAVGFERTLGGVVYSFAEVIAPGVVQTGDAPSRLVIGRLDGAASPAADRVAAALIAGGFGAEVTPHIRRPIWSKLLGNLGSGPFAVLTGLPVGPALTSPALDQAAIRVLDEVAAIARAAGIDPGDALASLPGLRRSQHRPSMLQDLDAGRPMEIDSLYTVPLAIAAELGVAAPTLELLAALVAGRARAAGLYPT